MTVHVPVLKEEAIEGLELKPGMIVVDATLGGGGYTQSIVEKIGSKGLVISIDRDRDALDRFAKKIGTDPARDHMAKVECIHGSFGDLKHLINEREIQEVDAVVADLGLSSDQLEIASRGFSFLLDGPLDMRMDQTQSVTAFRIVNDWKADELEKIFREYGDERHARRISRLIEKTRSKRSISGTKELAELIARAVPGSNRSRIHPATRIFQALRMAVNDEVGELTKLIDQSFEILKVGGRISVVTFHSGEDRVVKREFRRLAQDCICPSELPICQCDHRAVARIITKKPIIPGEKEIQDNIRSRSAKLRIAEKK